MRISSGPINFASPTCSNPSCTRTLGQGKKTWHIEETYAQCCKRECARVLVKTLKAEQDRAHFRAFHKAGTFSPVKSDANFCERHAEYVAACNVDGALEPERMTKRQAYNAFKANTVDTLKEQGLNHAWVHRHALAHFNKLYKEEVAKQREQRAKLKLDKAKLDMHKAVLAREGELQTGDRVVHKMGSCEHIGTVIEAHELAFTVRWPGTAHITSYTRTNYYSCLLKVEVLETVWDEDRAS